MIYGLGVLTGLTVAVLLLLLDIRLTKRGNSVVQRVEAAIEKPEPSKQGTIFLAPDDLSYAQELHMQQNEAEGRDTTLEELLK